MEPIGVLPIAAAPIGGGPTIDFAGLPAGREIFLDKDPDQTPTVYTDKDLLE